MQNGGHIRRCSRNGKLGDSSVELRLAGHSKGSAIALGGALLTAENESNEAPLPRVSYSGMLEDKEKRRGFSFQPPRGISTGLHHYLEILRGPGH